MQLFRASLVETSARLRSGAIDILNYMTQILSSVEQWEPHVRSLLTEEGRRDRLMREAVLLKNTYPEPDARPPLYGIPVGTKDLYNVDGFPTRAGSQLPAYEFEGRQSSLVSRLKELGAIILGKTAMDEFAYAEPSPTRNPHNLNHTPGGSSSGSAAAVACGMSPLSIGTQTSRSIIAPACFCGVVGFKPTYGRIPLNGVILMSQSLDTAGLITQDADSMTMAASLLIPDWVKENSNRRPALGIPDGKFMTYVSDEMRKAFAVRVEILAEAGYEIRQVRMPWDDHLEDIYQSNMMLLHGEMARIHAQWADKYRSLYGRRTLQAITLGQKVSTDDLSRCRKGQAILRSKINNWMDEHGIGLWITPSQAAPAPQGYEITGWGGMTIPWSYAGMPCITLPAGSLDELPVGVQCIGKFGRDEFLLSCAPDIAAVIDK